VRKQVAGDTDLIGGCNSPCCCCGIDQGKVQQARELLAPV
jgi:hypothetical protein